MLTLPPAPITRLLLARGAALWVVLRAAFLIGSALSASSLRTGPTTLGIPPAVALALAALAAALAVLDLHRRHEVLFLANVGVTRRLAALVAAAPTVAAELCVALGTSAAGVS